MRTALGRSSKTVLFAALVAGCAVLPGPGSAPGVGRAAPETEGTDAEGLSLRLSDYRGKVVMLGFWGDF